MLHENGKSADSYLTALILQINFTCRSIFGAQKIQRRLSDASDEDEDEGEKKSAGKSELPEERKPTRRKATDILAEVSTLLKQM